MLATELLAIQVFFRQYFNCSIRRSTSDKSQSGTLWESGHASGVPNRRLHHSDVCGGWYIVIRYLLYSFTQNHFLNEASAAHQMGPKIGFGPHVFPVKTPNLECFERWNREKGQNGFERM
ncbi:unnamed protein product, partial [Nesidiocoris tenuis]